MRFGFLCLQMWFECDVLFISSFTSPASMSIWSSKWSQKQNSSTKSNCYGKQIGTHLTKTKQNCNTHTSRAEESSLSRDDKRRVQLRLLVLNQFQFARLPIIFSLLFRLVSRLVPAPYLWDFGLGFWMWLPFPLLRASFLDCHFVLRFARFLVFRMILMYSTFFTVPFISFLSNVQFEPKWLFLWSIPRHCTLYRNMYSYRYRIFRWTDDESFTLHIKHTEMHLSRRQSNQIKSNQFNQFIHNSRNKILENFSRRQLTKTK